MVSTTVLFAAITVAVAGCLSTVQAHGYMYSPEAVPLAKHNKDKMISSWIVQIEPQFDADWNSVKDDTELIALYAEKAKEAGYESNIKKLLDSDTNVYGADCGYSDPNVDPKQPPTDGTATFSRGLAHHGPCEIWLDDTMAFHNDDCAKDFSVEDYMSIKSVFKPIDYSSCSSSGCMLRFYWLAFQGSTSGKYVWQIYKNCVPLTGPAAGQTSTASTASNTTQTAGVSSPGSSTTEPPATNPPDSGDQSTQASKSTDAITTPTPVMATNAPAPVTPSTTDKCKAPKRKRA